ncbi:MAG: hypothetical protein JWL88_290 [Parcubacteria group bacterium]|nr:hypothetical protein [Parcubacteria group bacterium]
MDEREKSRILSHFARSLRIPADASLEEINKAIDMLPEDSMVHPQDIREELSKLLKEELTLA